MPPSLRGKINDGVGGYGVNGSGRAYESHKVVQHLRLVSISILCYVAIFGHGRSTVLIRFNPPSDFAKIYDNTFLGLAAFTALLIGKTLISSMVQVT